MKKLAYVAVVLFGLIATSCTEDAVRPQNEDDPIVIPPPPPKH